MARIAWRDAKTRCAPGKVVGEEADLGGVDCQIGPAAAHRHADLGNCEGGPFPLRSGECPRELLADASHARAARV